MENLDPKLPLKHTESIKIRFPHVLHALGCYSGIAFQSWSILAKLPNTVERETFKNLK